MKIATIILNWNGLADTKECLTSLQQIEVDGWEHQIVVVDNGSTDGSVEMIERHFSLVEVLRQNSNVGFARGNNIALQWAMERGYDAAILLNNDTVVAKDSFQRLVSYWQNGQLIGAVMPNFHLYGSQEVWYSGGRLVQPWGRVQHFTSAEADRPYQIEVVTACCVLLPLAVLQKTGLFDERYFLYLEDTDLALRIGEAGYKIWAEPRAIVEHKVSRSSGGAMTPDPIYYQIRNNLLLIHDHQSERWKRWLGYGYVGVLSFKIGLNIWMRGMRSKRLLLTAIGQAWNDAARAKWGKRM